MINTELGGALLRVKVKDGVLVEFVTEVENRGTRLPLENEVTVPPVPDAVRFEPVRVKPEPIEISVIAFPPVLGLPSSFPGPDAGSIFEYVTAPVPMVKVPSLPMDASPDRVTTCGAAPVLPTTICPSVIAEEPASIILPALEIMMRLFVSAVPEFVPPFATAAIPVILEDVPVTDPVIGFVTIRFPKVPTLVRLLVTTDEFKVAPVKVPAAAVTVIGTEPSKLTPFIVFPGDNFVAVPAFPVIEPVIGLVTVRFPKVPTLVRLLVITEALKVLPVNVPAAAVTVIGADPSKLTPFIVVPGDNLPEVLAFPVIDPMMGELKVLLPAIV